MQKLSKINRTGRFVAHADADHPNQCGTTGARVYAYNVTIEADGHKLSPEGFVMNREEVDKYFFDTYEQGNLKCDSCENMASRAVTHFFGLFARADLMSVQVTRIAVRLSGDERGWVESELIL